MLAATQDKPKSLELIKLFLDLISSNEKKIPSELKEQFVLIVSQASQLVKEPTGVDENTLIEAIDLALELKRLGGLQQDLEKVIESGNDVSIVASRVLKSMENTPVYQDGSLSFT